MRTMLLALLTVLAALTPVLAQAPIPAGPRLPLVDSRTTRGITVFGRATVPARATRTRFSVTFMQRTFGTSPFADVDRVTAAFVRAGVDPKVLRPQLGAQIFQNGGLTFTVYGSMEGTSRDRAAGIARAVLAELGASTSIALQNLAFGYAVDDCSAAEEAARRAAFADAQRHAVAAARDAHVTLGEVMSVNDQGSFSTACVPPSSSNPLEFAGNGSLDLSPEPTVFVSASVSVTFAIR